jgi:hypothetical protein
MQSAAGEAEAYTSLRSGWRFESAVRDHLASFPPKSVLLFFHLTSGIVTLSNLKSPFPNYRLLFLARMLGKAQDFAI